MKSSKMYLAVTAVTALVGAAPAGAAGIDMDDPRRAVGREDDIRVDAQLLTDTVAVGQAIGVTYQIQNMTAAPIAVADKATSASYDTDSQTITLALGSEIPANGNMPRMVVIPPGQTKTFSGGAMCQMPSSARRSRSSASPRYVRIKVHLLRNLGTFRDLIARAAESVRPIPLTDAQFDAWLETSDTIFLNELPVRFDPSGSRRMMSAEEGQRHSLFRTH
jgi:hypothetical protein